MTRPGWSLLFFFAFAALGTLHPLFVRGKEPSGVMPEPAGTDAVFDPALLPLRRGEVPSGPAFQPLEAPFQVVIREDAVPSRVFFVPVLPEEALSIELGFTDDQTTLRYSAGTVRTTATGWAWEAPADPGTVALRLERPRSSQVLSLNVFVLHPFDRVRAGALNDYRIGEYASRPLRGDSVYLSPPGFIEVASGDEDILVSPHFTVGQFLCKQPGNPKYLVLSRYLVAKLERTLERVNAAGYAATSLHVMSGFRTPWYNRSIGNRTMYSRHLWGGAADVFLDVDGDGTMDDLNGDGRSTVADAQILFAIAEEVDGSPDSSTRAGGLGVYRRNAFRGPFVHVDARGRSARW